MSTATGVPDTERLVAELRKDGVPEVKAYAIARLIANVQQPGFDALAVHADLVAAGYTALEADTLVQEVIERMSKT
jgi:hypothetical protein